jgi:endonuclease/exonuclease/phosphatase family metal-dependent hydrolase
MPKLCTYTYHKIQKYNLVIIMGDFNTKMRKEEYQKWQEYSTHISDKNGNPLEEFATKKGLKIKSTTLQHKHIHLGTSKVTGSSKVNQIDHVLVSLRHSTSIIYVQTSRGPNCDTDHYLVKTIARERIVRTEKMKGVNPKDGIYRNYK